MRRARGYTLLELGIVITVMILLLTAIAVTATGFFRGARALRTGNEFNALARAGANALQRNLRVQPGLGCPGGLCYSFFDGVAPVPLNAMVPVCYNISKLTGPNCRVNGAAGAAWAGGAAQVLATNPLVAMLGGDKVYSNGFNAWCEPYVICLYLYRAEALTCVPKDDADSLVGAQQCTAPCADSPLTGEPTVCILTSAPTSSQSTQQLKLSYSHLFIDPPQIGVAQTRALPLVFIPGSSLNKQ